MGRVRLYVLAAMVLAALLASPIGTRADSLTGSVGITWFFPDTSTVFASDSIAVGASLNCPGGSAICNGYAGVGNEAFSVGSSSVSYTASGFGSTGYSSATFNGFDFTGFSFVSGGTLTGFTLTTDISGLTASDVTFGPSSIEINLQGLPVNGSFTLDLASSAGSGSLPAPEPSSLVLMLAGVVALAAFALKKVVIV